MKRLSAVLSLLSVTLLSCNLASAQGHGHGYERQRGYEDRGAYESRGPYESRGAYPQERGPDRREMYQPPPRDMYRHDPYARRYMRDDRMDRRWPGPDREYQRGDRLPMDYRQDAYVVEDWRGHGLRTPPRGYQWVQSGADYILIGMATGLILDILLNH